jgi:hypothetical protein
MSAPVRLLFLTSLPVMSDAAVAVVALTMIAVAHTSAIDRESDPRAGARSSLKSRMFVPPPAELPGTLGASVVDQASGQQITDSAEAPYR